MEEKMVESGLIKEEFLESMPCQARVEVQLQEQLKCEVEPQMDAAGMMLAGSMDCLVDYNLGTQLTVEQEIQIGDGAPACLGFDMSFLPRKAPKPRQRRASGARNFSCGQCGKSFLRGTDLARHEKAHTEERTYVCNICGKNFRRHTSLLIHARIHTGERPYQCTQCGKSFVQRQHLTTHQRTHTGEKPFQCIECGKGFRWRSELIKHQKNHTEKSALGFDDLAASFSKEEWMELEEWQKELYRNVMKETSETLISLAGEVWINKNGKEMQPGRNPDDPETSSDSKDDITLGTEPGSEMDPESDPQGLRDFSSNHLQGDEPHTSTDAFRGFRHSLPFLEQRRAPQVPREKLFPCMECEKRFARNTDLLKHQRSHQAGVKPNLCNECGKIFRRRTSLLIHKRIHTGERPYKCKECGKSFVQRQHLTTHVKTHTGERPYPCIKCGKSYRWRSELVKHQKVHGEDMPEALVEFTRG
ncbi:hypothetical protein FKM82_020844 [Ascaphus truei]